MKKYLVLIVSLVILTGRGKETLTCTKEEKNDTGSASYTVNVTFKNKKVTNAEIGTVVTVSDEYKAYSNVMKTALESSFETYKDKKGITTSIEDKDGKISASVKFDVTKMSDDDKKTLEFDTEGTKNSAKASFEKEGYKCK